MNDKKKRIVAWIVICSMVLTVMAGTIASMFMGL